jgi:hypothetical protein
LAEKRSSAAAVTLQRNRLSGDQHAFAFLKLPTWADREDRAFLRRCSAAEELYSTSPVFLRDLYMCNTLRPRHVRLERELKTARKTTIQFGSRSSKALSYSL